MSTTRRRFGKTMVEVVHPCEFRFIRNSPEQLWLLDKSASRGRQSVAKMMSSFAFSCLSHHRGMSGYAGTPRFSAVEAHTEHRVLVRRDGGPIVPPPPDPKQVIWLVILGFRLRPRTLRLRLKVRTPLRTILPWVHYLRIDPLGPNQYARWKHQAILPWAHYLRIDPLGWNQNAWWKDPLLVTPVITPG